MTEITFEPITCTYLNHMGSDKDVVRNARVSFGREDDNDNDTITDKDADLIRFLATGFRKSEWNEMIRDVRTMDDLNIHSLFLKLRRHPTHWAPMAHPHMKLKITAPIFVARQYMKHQVGLIWSETSRRYVDDKPTFFKPEVWRSRPEGGIKQGSGDEAVELLEFEPNVFESTDEVFEGLTQIQAEVYQEMIKNKVAPELARMVLGQHMMVQWVWTGSLAAFARVCQQRLDPHAQKEAQILAAQIYHIMGDLFPVTWDAMVGGCWSHVEATR
jgi:thymidylate synthase (FAD)